MPAVMSAADATKSLRVGTNVLNNDLRHPVLLARETATLDLLTDGRFELGLGAGYVQAEYDQAGLRFDRGGIRVERLAESVRIIKGLLGGAEVNVRGQHYRVTGHTIHPRSVQRPHPPILIGGSGERRTLGLVARYGDACNLLDLPEPYRVDLRHKLDVLAGHVYGERDPAELFHHELEQELITDNGSATLRVPLPFAERGELELKKIGLEVIVRVGGQKRTIVLPPAMSAYATSGARFEEGALRIFFEKDADER